MVESLNGESARIRSITISLPGDDARYEGQAEGEGADCGQQDPQYHHQPGGRQRVQQTRRHHLTQQQPFHPEFGEKNIDSLFRRKLSYGTVNRTSHVEKDKLLSSWAQLTNNLASANR